MSNLHNRTRGTSSLSSLHLCLEGGLEKAGHAPESTQPVGTKAGLASAWVSPGDRDRSGGESKEVEGQTDPSWLGGMVLSRLPPTPNVPRSPHCPEVKLGLPVKSCSGWSPVPRPQEALQQSHRSGAQNKGHLQS